MRRKNGRSKKEMPFQAVLSLVNSYLPLLAEVSQSHAGQIVGIL